MRIRRPRSDYILLAILLLALGLRLYHVTYPYLDHNSWRQTDTAAVARNFSRSGFNILRPELDMFGPGRTAELELQITPFLTALLYKIWGIQDWVGRVVPILFSLGSIVYFYLFVRVLFGQRCATLSAFVFSILPLNVYFTRVQMPESGAMFFAIAAVYHFSVYLQKETNLQYALAVGLTSLAFLAKLTNLYLLMPLAALAVARYGRRFWSNVRLWLFALITLAATAAYYGYVHVTADIKLIKYQIGDTGMWANLPILTNPLLYGTLAYRLRTIIYTDLGLVLLVVGFLLPTNNQVFRVWILSALVYTFAVATASFVHTYYQMPLIPAGAFFIGSALDRIAAVPRWRPLAGALCATLLALTIMHLLPMYRIYGMPAYEAAQALKQIDTSGSPVLSVPEQRGTAPEILYYADRKGWVLYPNQLTVQGVDRFRALGAQYVVVADYHLIPVSTRRYFARYEQWQGERTLIVRLAP